MQMPFGIRQQAERIRSYATMAAAEAQSSPASELVALMHRSADDLEIAAQFMIAALGPAPLLWTRRHTYPIRSSRPAKPEGLPPYRPTRPRSR